MKTKWILLVICFALVLSGCMTTRIPDLSETMVSPGLPPTPESNKETVYVGQSTEPFRGAGNPEKHSLSFVDMEIRQALAVLSSLSNIPIVAEPGVSGAVNLSVEGKTVAEILMAMSKQFGYSVFIEDGVVIVGKPRMVTRAFYLNYLRDKRSSKSVTNASISSTAGSDGGGSGGSHQGNVTVTTSGDTDFWKELKEGLQHIVFGTTTSGDQSINADPSGKKIVVNDMTGVVYVTDTEENMDIVGSFLSDIDKELKRQVLIQAHIVEVDLDNKFSLGVNWDGVLNSGSRSVNVLQNLTAGAEVSDLFSIKMIAKDFDLMLDALKTQGHVNMLSSPKISTMNNQKAVIKLTTKEVTWIQETTNFSSGAESITTSLTPQIDEVGLFLDVTPNIDAFGVVTMHIHPSISEIKEFSTVQSGELVLRKPVISVREVDTMVEVNSGETVVIAGLIVDKTREVKRSVPILGDIPFLGMLFSNFEQELKKTELAIFLTPFVLESQSIVNIRRHHEKRLNQLEELSGFIESRSQQKQTTNTDRQDSTYIPVEAEKSYKDVTVRPSRTVPIVPTEKVHREPHKSAVSSEPEPAAPNVVHEEPMVESAIDVEERSVDQSSPVVRSTPNALQGDWATPPPRRW